MNTDDRAAGDGEVRREREGDVLRLTLDRPARRNALSAGMVAALVTALEDAAVDDTLRAVLLRGAGTDFCAGADWVAANAGNGERPRAGHLARRVPLGAHRVIQLLHDLRLPVVCAVRGWAVGLGLGIALAADFTVAADDTRFWAPFSRRGFTPDSGSTWMLPRLIGIARAKELLLLAREITGADAAGLGLIHRAVPDADLDNVASDLADDLARGPTVALGLAKALVNASAQRTLADSLAEEAATLELSSRTLDFREGLRAFAERRDPEFRGR